MYVYVHNYMCIRINHTLVRSEQQGTCRTCPWHATPQGGECRCWASKILNPTRGFNVPSLTGLAVHEMVILTTRATNISNREIESTRGCKGLIFRLFIYLGCSYYVVIWLIFAYAYPETKWSNRLPHFPPSSLIFLLFWGIPVAPPIVVHSSHW